MGIEAQFSGLPCLFSRGVPEEVSFSKATRFLDLSEPLSVWVDTVLELSAEVNPKENSPRFDYDIEKVAVDLQNRYEVLAKQEFLC